MTTALPTSDRRGDAFTYLNTDGDLVEGVVWCPGPVSRSVWVLPAGAHRSAEAVVCRHPVARRPTHHLDGRRDWPEGFDGWWQDWRVTPGPFPQYSNAISNERSDARGVKGGLSAKDWRDAVTADPTIGEQLGLEAVA